MNTIDEQLCAIASAITRKAIECGGYEKRICVITDKGSLGVLIGDYPNSISYHVHFTSFDGEPRLDIWQQAEKVLGVLQEIKNSIVDHGLSQAELACAENLNVEVAA